MDPTPLVLVLATSLALPPGPDIDNTRAHKPAEVRRLDRAKAWLRDHWEQQMKVLEESQACVTQARSWGDVGVCARIAQQSVRVTEMLQTSVCLPAQDGLASLQASGSP